MAKLLIIYIWHKATKVSCPWKRNEEELAQCLLCMKVKTSDLMLQYIKFPPPLKKKKNTAYQTILGLEYTALNTV